MSDYECKNEYCVNWGKYFTGKCVVCDRQRKVCYLEECRARKRFLAKDDEIKALLRIIGE